MIIHFTLVLAPTSQTSIRIEPPLAREAKWKNDPMGSTNSKFDQLGLFHFLLLAENFAESKIGQKLTVHSVHK